MYLQHFGRDPVDIRIGINAAIRIEILVEILAEVCTL